MIGDEWIFDRIESLENEWVKDTKHDWKMFVVFHFLFEFKKHAIDLLIKAANIFQGSHRFRP